MAHMPKVSVIIPVYNVEKYLEECLDSVIGQTLEDIEIICVDDGSTDSSLKILREYEKRDSRISILTQENQGAGAARNKGLAIAKGEYLSFLDADDFFERKMLQKAYETALDVDADIVVYGSDRYIQNEDKYVDSYTVNYKLLPSSKSFAATDIPQNIFRAVIGWTWDKLFKKSFIDKCNLKFQEIRVHNDLLFTFAAWASAQRITVIKDIFTHQRKRGGGSISDEFKVWWCTFDALYGLKQYIELHDLKERFFLDYINYVVYLMLYNSKRLNEKSRQEFYGHMRRDWMWQLGFFEAQDNMFYNRKELETCKRMIFSSESKNREKYSGMASEMVKVSVIVPTLNSIQYIDECIQSVLNQTLHEIEIICIDAGSNDGTLERLQQYAETDARIKIINSDRKSYGYQVNLGLDVAKGDYFAILESDDYILEDMYQVLYDLAVKHDLDSVKSDFCIFSGNGDSRTFTYRYLMEDRNYYDRVLNPNDDISLFHANNVNPPGIYSLQFIQQHHIRLVETPGASYQDNSLWFQIFAHSKRMLFCPRPFYMIRRDNENSSVNSKAKIFCVCDVYDYIRNILKTTEDFEKKYAPICALYRFYNYTWTLNRIADEYKLVFLYKFSHDFNNISSFGELEEALFPKHDWNTVHQIMQDPYQYYSTRFMSNRSIQLQSVISRTRGTPLYHIARFFTWLPRKIFGGIRCYQENGFRYTVRQVLVHLHLIKDEYIATSKQLTPPTSAPMTMVKRDYNFYEQLPSEKYEDELKLWYRSVTGTELNLDNPRTFNEKIQWLKLYDSTPIKTRLADKYQVRDWVKSKIGEEYLIPLLGVWDSFDQIDFDKLPDRFVLKANHGSGWNLIVKDKSQLDMDEAKRKFDTWIQKNFAFLCGLELHYMNIPPKIIAEEYIEEINETLYDYRFFCFNGEPKYVWLDSGSGTANHKRNIYDLNWSLQDCSVNYPRIEPDPPKPDDFDKMVKLAAILCKNFALVRVDFYLINKKIYFGEMTFTPQTGIGKWNPPQLNYIYGDFIQLPPKSPLPERLF